MNPSTPPTPPSPSFTPPAPIVSPPMITSQAPAPRKSRKPLIVGLLAGFLIIIAGGIFLARTFLQSPPDPTLSVAELQKLSEDALPSLEAMSAFSQFLVDDESNFSSLRDFLSHQKFQQYLDASQNFYNSIHKKTISASGKSEINQHFQDLEKTLKKELAACQKVYSRFQKLNQAYNEGKTSQITDLRNQVSDASIKAELLQFSKSLQESLPTRQQYNQKQCFSQAQYQSKVCLQLRSQLDKDSKYFSDHEAFIKIFPEIQKLQQLSDDSSYLVALDVLQLIKTGDKR